ENDSVALPGVTVTSATGDETDPVTATLTVANGTLHVDDTSLPTGVTVGTNDSGAITVSGLADDVNDVLASLTYTPTGEYEGPDTLHVTATSTDGTAAESTASAEQTIAITVEPVSDTPSVAVASGDETATVQENDSVALPGVTVTSATGDETDPVTATLTVANGTLHVDDTSLPTGVTVGTNDSGAITVSGLADDVNDVLASLTYTPTGEYEGPDTLHVTATSTDG